MNVVAYMHIRDAYVSYLRERIAYYAKNEYLDGLSRSGQEIYCVLLEEYATYENAGRKEQERIVREWAGRSLRDNN